MDGLEEVSDVSECLTEIWQKVRFIEKTAKASPSLNNAIKDLDVTIDNIVKARGAQINFEGP